MRVKLFKGKATVVGRKSEHSLYSKKLATYESGDSFDHDAAKGFIRLFGLSQQTQAQRQLLKGGKGFDLPGLLGPEIVDRESWIEKTSIARFTIHDSRFTTKEVCRCMGSDMMDMEQLAAYLQRDVREVGKLASRGHLPGHKVGGQWRFARAEINHWIETQMHALTEKQLTSLESSGARRRR